MLSPNERSWMAMLCLHWAKKVSYYIEAYEVADI